MMQVLESFKEEKGRLLFVKAIMPQMYPQMFPFECYSIFCMVVKTALRCDPCVLCVCVSLVLPSHT